MSSKDGWKFSKTEGKLKAAMKVLEMASVRSILRNQNLIQVSRSEESKNMVIFKSLIRWEGGLVLKCDGEGVEGEKEM